MTIGSQPQHAAPVQGLPQLANLHTRVRHSAVLRHHVLRACCPLGASRVHICKLGQMLHREDTGQSVCLPQPLCRHAHKHQVQQGLSPGFCSQSYLVLLLQCVSAHILSCCCRCKCVCSHPLVLLLLQMHVCPHPVRLAANLLAPKQALQPSNQVTPEQALQPVSPAAVATGVGPQTYMRWGRACTPLCLAVSPSMQPRCSSCSRWCSMSPCASQPSPKSHTS